jgi:putative ABC transport system permease protein
VIGYYIRLALHSFGRTPGLTALMICTIALGISACVVTLTVYQATSRDPIWWKSDRLYALTIDSWDPNEAFNPKRPDLPPAQLSYTDAKYLLGSTIPERKVAMFRTQDVILSGAADAKPTPIATRVTTADFFDMFDVPFLYGTGWNSTNDDGAQSVIVLSKDLNQRLFGGANSVGRTVLWNDRGFVIVGVLNTWSPLPKFYDLTSRTPTYLLVGPRHSGAFRMGAVSPAGETARSSPSRHSSNRTVCGCRCGCSSRTRPIATTCRRCSTGTGRSSASRDAFYAHATTGSRA